MWATLPRDDCHVIARADDLSCPIGGVPSSGRTTASAVVAHRRPCTDKDPAVRRTLLCGLWATGCGLLFGGGAANAASPPPIKHVFVLVLENKDYDDVFGPG